jgi:selenoprotein W-related protein
VSLADVLLTGLKREIASLEMVPGKGGCFEVDVNGKRIYSKLETGQFPDEADILRMVAQSKK